MLLLSSRFDGRANADILHARRGHHSIEYAPRPLRSEALAKVPFASHCSGDFPFEHYSCACWSQQPGILGGLSWETLSGVIWNWWRQGFLIRRLMPSTLLDSTYLPVQLAITIEEQTING